MKHQSALYVNANQRPNLISLRSDRSPEEWCICWPAEIIPPIMC